MAIIPQNVYYGIKTKYLNKFKIDYQGTVATVSDLPEGDIPKGTVYNVEANGSNYLWTGESWDELGSDDSNLVHKTGNETINGTKTFESIISGSVSGTAQDIAINGDVTDLASARGLFGEMAETASNVNLNTIRAQGFYKIAGSATTNTPSGVTNGYLMVLVNGNWVKQVFFRHGTLDSNDFQTYIRTSNSATSFSDWKRLAVHNESTLELSGTTTLVKVKNTKVESLGSIPASNSYTGISGCTAGGDAFGAAQFIAWNIGAVATRLVAKQNVASDPVSVYADLSVYADGSSDFKTPTHLPNEDNSFTLGDASKRWKEVFANTGTINTSDERLKVSIGSIPDAVLDAWDDVDWCQFQFKDAVVEKGTDARLHSGLIAQRIDEAFKARGLNAAAYGLFCYDSWEAVDRDESYEEKPAVLDEDGNEVKPAVIVERHVHEDAGNMYSLRYEEALAMEAAYQRRRADRAEARIKALEDRLEALEARLG